MPERETDLKQAIEAYIASLHLAPGSQVPTETKLCHKFGATRYQVRKALENLTLENGWTKIRGSGTYLPGGDKINRPVEKVIALVVPHSPNLARQAMAAHSHALEKGFQLLVFGISHDSVEYENECLEHLLPRRIHSLIVEPHPGNPGNFELFDRFARAGTRVVLLNCPEDRRGRYRVFDFDYRRAGYMAVVDLMRQGVKEIVHMCQLDSIAWQHRQFRAGVDEAAADFRFPLEHMAASLALDTVNFAWSWLPGDFEFPLRRRCGYIDDNNPFEASYCHTLLKAAGIGDSPMISVYTSAYALPFSMLLFDYRARLLETVKILIDTPANALPSSRTFKPELCLPGETGASSVLSFQQGLF